MSNVENNRIASLGNARLRDSIELRHGQIGGHTVTVGGGDDRPTRGTRALNAIGNFFHGIGAALTSLKDRISNAWHDYQANRAETARVKEFNAVKTGLLETLPPGVQIDAQGVISGSFTTNSYPIDDKGLGAKSGQAFARSLEDSAVSMLTPKIVEGEQIALTQIHGIDVSNQAVSDFWRMDMTIDHGGGAYRTRADATEGQHERNAAVVDELRQFTGNDNATSVLSTVLTQNLSRPLLECFCDANGDRRDYAINQGKLGEQMYRGVDGVERMINPPGIGDMKLEVSRDNNGNFVVEAKWDYYLDGTGRGFSKKPFEGMDGSMMKAETSMTIVIDSASASNGVLQVLGDVTVNVDFAGHMKT